MNASLLVIFLSILISDRCAASTDFFEEDVEIATTWMTPFGPEVHVLLTNNSLEPVPFSVGFIQDKDVRKVCESDLKTLDSNFHHRYEKGARRQPSNTAGIIEPSSWSHRHFVVGATGGVSPCSVNVIVRVGEEHVERKIYFPRNIYYPPTSTRDSKQLEVSTIVEKVRGSSDAYIRTRVENKDDKTAYLLVLDRLLNCKKNGRARWANAFSSLQGMNSGPVVLDESKWVVFVDIVESLENTDNAKSQCSGSIVIGGYDEDYELIELSRSEFEIPYEIGTYVEIVPQ